MKKNITLSADECLIAAARETAAKRQTTLNQEFRAWIARYSEPEGASRVSRYRALMKSLDHVSAGARFSRDELNER